MQTSTMKILKTKHRLAKEERESKIYKEYLELNKSPDAMASAIELHLMNKYKIYSRATIWKVIKRAGERFNNAKNLK